MDDLSISRHRMVEDQIRSRGILDPAILRAFEKVERHRFVPEAHFHKSYDDHPVPIGHGQTISQPYMVAYMLEHLQVRPGLRVLEIGTGSGYQTALLAELGARVFTVERVPELSLRAQTLLGSLGYAGISFAVGDGTLGWIGHAPFDRIIVSAAAPDVPQALKDQLADGGILLIPVGPEHAQDLLSVRRKGLDFAVTNLGACVFVRLIGEQGWPRPPASER
jgi:protein-L-isoaspartate(D-aspartate) O-methyltransferase